MSYRRLRVTRPLLTCFAVFLFPYFCFADFTGPVVSVLDGDTLEVLNGHHAERIRLSGIDCPEKGQAYGKEVTFIRAPLLICSHAGQRQLEGLGNEVRWFVG